MRKQVYAGWIAAAVLMAGCGVGGGASTGEAGATTTPAPAAVTQTALPATSLPLARPTTAPPNGGGARPVFPIFDGESGYLLGGVEDGRWLDVETTASLVSGPRDYRLVVPGSPPGQVSGTIVTPETESDPCAFPRVDTGNAGSKVPGSIGVAGDWDINPRDVQRLDPDLPDYQAAIRDLLIQQGIAEPDVRITGLYRADLEGDGVDEVVINAVRLANTGLDGSVQPMLADGDYNLVAIRSLGDSQVRTIPFILEVYPKAPPVEQSYPWRPTILALLDLNGDGRLEIVVREDAIEGRMVEVYEVNGAEVNPVLSAGCSI